MFKIALAQTRVHPGNPRQNAAIMKDFIAKAKAAHCDIVVFPELSIPGYFIGDIWDQPDYIDECVRFGDEIRDLSQGIAIIFGNVAKETDRVNLDGRTRKYNAMFIAYNGKWLSPARSPYPFYIKTLLPNYREFSDIRYFTSLIEVAQERHAFPEDFLSPVQIPFDDGRKFRIGPLICEDSWDENYPFKPMHYLGKMYDIDLFVNVSNSPFTLGKTQRRHRLFGQAIDKIHCPAIYVNCTGIQNNGKNIYTFDGASSTYQKDGSHHSACTPLQKNCSSSTSTKRPRPLRPRRRSSRKSRRSKIFTTASTTASSTLWIPSASIKSSSAYQAASTQRSTPPSMPRSCRRKTSFWSTCPAATIRT